MGSIVTHTIGEERPEIGTVPVARSHKNAAADPEGIYSFTVELTDDGNPAYSSEITCYGRVYHYHLMSSQQVANDDFVRTTAGTSIDLNVTSNDVGWCGEGPEIVDGPSHGTASVLGDPGYTYLKYVPASGFHGVDTFTYDYPDRLVDIMPPYQVYYEYLASNVATVHVAVDPVVVQLDVQGEWGTGNSRQAILPLNTGWDEQGVSGDARVQDYEHAGIVADDPQLRSATLDVTNDYPLR